MQPTDEDISKTAKKFALLNAIEHNGKADSKSVIGRILSENSDLRRFAQRVRDIVSAIVTEVNRMSAAEQSAMFRSRYPGELEERTARKKEIAKSDSQRTELPELVGAETGNVITRFPPEPNGYMHIGHAKAAIIGYEYAKKYSGEFLLRFDDTNPAAEKIEYYEAFRDSLRWLNITPSKTKNASDDMEKFYELAEKLINYSKAYICSCSQDIMRHNRAEGVPCEHRLQERQQNMSLWGDMLSGKLSIRATLRFTGDMKSQNTTMRDPVLFREVEGSHPIKGTQYRVWPTYDFDGPVEDSLDGVTHAMRSKEYELRDQLYFAILDALQLRRPRIIEFSRLELQNTTVSKRSLRKLIENNYVKDWDDPRLPTISGLKRRGFLPEAIRDFVLSMGVSKVESQPTWDLLESINRKLLDPIAKRFFFVENPISLHVENAPEVNVSLKFHPERNYGERTITTNGKFFLSSSDASQLKPGDKARLIEVYNIEILSSDNGIRARYAGEENIEKIRRIQWVVPESLPFKVIIIGPLLINDDYNPNSIREATGLIESGGSDLKIGEIFQLVRFGFCRLDSSGVAILTHK